MHRLKKTVTFIIARTQSYYALFFIVRTPQRHIKILYIIAFLDYGHSIK